MFTGIVEEVGEVAQTSDTGLSINASVVMDDLKVSDSICVNGTCLTVTDINGSTFSVDTVPETLRRTNLGKLSNGDPVNLERPLAADGRFGGHVVQGHIDGTGKVTSVEADGEAHIYRFEGPDNVMRYVVEKGFVAVDGTSLTVVDCDHRTFSVTIIPFTLEHTVFKSRKSGDTVNLEADIMAKYVERLSSGPKVPVDLADEL